MMLGGSKKGIDSCLCVVFFNGKWNDMIYIYKSIYVIIYLIIYIYMIINIYYYVYIHICDYI